MRQFSFWPLALVALLIGFAGIAIAQTYPTLFVSYPVGSETMDIRGNGPQITSIRVSQVRDAAGYTKQIPLTGATIQIPPYTSRLALNPAGTLAALTVTLPANPVDGQIMFMFTSQAITAFTLNPSPGQTLNNAVTTLNANGTANYLYSASNATWDRD